MTPAEIIRRLVNYAAKAERRAETNRWLLKRHEARGEARAYRTAIEWLELMEEEK